MTAKKPTPIRKVAIVGFTEHRKHAPWDQDDWEIWGMNNLHAIVGPEQTAKASMWFNLHGRAESEKDEAHTTWARADCKVPYLTFEPWDGYPTNAVFPASDLTVKYGTKYFTNSVSWMIAYAMTHLEDALNGWRDGRPAAEKGDKLAEWDEKMRPVIGVWGVDMAATSEYAAQRPSCEFFLGLASGLGYGIAIAEGSDLLKSASMYGVGDDSEMRAKMEFRMGEHQSKIGELNAKRSQLLGELGQVDGQINQFQGAFAELQYFHGIWTQPSVESTRKKSTNV